MLGKRMAGEWAAGRRRIEVLLIQVDIALHMGKGGCRPFENCIGTRLPGFRGGGWGGGDGWPPRECALRVPMCAHFLVSLSAPQSSLPNTTLELSHSVARRSTWGAIILHGPHLRHEERAGSDVWWVIVTREGSGEQQVTLRAL